MGSVCGIFVGLIKKAQFFCGAGKETVFVARHTHIFMEEWKEKGRILVDPLPAYLSLIPSSIEINYKTIFEKCLPYGKDGAIIIIGLFWKGGCCCEG